MGDFETSALRRAASDWVESDVRSDAEYDAAESMRRLCIEAADEIDKLRAEAARWREEVATINELLEDLAIKAFGIKVAGMRFDDIRAYAGLPARPQRATSAWPALLTVKP